MQTRKSQLLVNYLSDAFLHRLQAINILHDRDDDGKFLQLYSRPFPGGMFFDIIERRDGYMGYGAPNVRFGIAAQALRTTSHASR